MKLVHTIHEARVEIAAARKAGRTIGLVPTMGALHHGHAELARRARAECGYVAVSIFVNPTQFGPREDYARYPRTLENDVRLLTAENADLVFNPPVEEMYLPGETTRVEVAGLSDVLEGAHRPGHFRGVCTVVLKLFNILGPDRAYFGWKDAQQFIILRRMTRDLDLPVEMIGVPTVREPDGLAASSRNSYLSPTARSIAPAFYAGLQRMRKMVESEGTTEAVRVLAEGRKSLSRHPEIQVQYIEAVSLDALEPVAVLKQNTMIAGAIVLDGVRLIDNIIFE